MSKLVYPEAKRFYHNKIDGVHIFVFPVILAPYFMFSFAQKNDRIAPVLIIGKGFFYFNPRKNLDHNKLESDLISYFHKIKGDFDHSIIYRLLNPILAPLDGHKYMVFTAIDYLEYKISTGFKLVGNVAPYWWKNKELNE